MLRGGGIRARSRTDERRVTPSHIRRTSGVNQLIGWRLDDAISIVRRCRRSVLNRGAGGGNRTHTTLASPRILSAQLTLNHSVNSAYLARLGTVGGAGE